MHPPQGPILFTKGVSESTIGGSIFGSSQGSGENSLMQLSCPGCAAASEHSLLGKHSPARCK